MNVLFREARRYAVASACALLVDFCLLWALVEYVAWWYWAAAMTSFLAGMVVSYWLSIKLVFSERRLADQSMEFCMFALIGAVGLAINALVILIAVKCFGLHYLWGKTFAAAVTFIFNFVARRQLLFVNNAKTPEIALYGIQQ